MYVSENCTVFHFFCTIFCFFIDESKLLCFTKIEACLKAIGGVCSYTANALKNKSFKFNAFVNAAFSGFVSGALASKLTSKIKSKNVSEIASAIVGGISGGLMDW